MNAGRGTIALATLPAWTLVACVVGRDAVNAANGAETRDAFRARLSAGCHSLEECRALVNEATARYHACHECNEGLDDAQTASERAAPFERRAAAQVEERERAERERAENAAQSAATQAAIEKDEADKAQKRAKHVAWCSETRPARERQREVDERAAAEAAARREADSAERSRLAAYQKAHCRKVDVPQYDRVPCDDGSNVVKMCNVEIARYSEYECPASAPAKIRGREMPIRTDDDPQPARRARDVVRGPGNRYESDSDRANRACADVDAEAQIDGGVAQGLTDVDAAAPARRR